MSVAILRSSVPAAREDVQDREQVLGEFVLGTSHVFQEP
jgi:hypothetical protein